MGRSRTVGEHAAAVAVHGAAAVAAGPLVLLVGPVLFGVPHLASTARYVPAGFAAGARRGAHAVWAVLAAFAAVGLARAFGRFTPSPETFLLLAAGATAAVAGVTGRRRVAGVAVLVALAAALVAAPLQAVVAILFGHNLVAYVYWWRLAETATQRRAALVCAGVTLAVAGAIAAGALDRWLAPAADGAAWARAVLPFLGDATWIARLVAIAAFGQLMHYFVWLRAIPRAAPEAGRSVPVSPGLLVAFALAWLALVAVAVADLGSARVLYLAFAAGHGYLELGALPFLPTPGRPS